MVRQRQPENQQSLFDVVEDPGTLAPLSDADLEALAGVLDVLGVTGPVASSPGTPARDQAT